ncbi:MAG: hypothetical protein M1833_004137 [Piccolia ochrophora]|nr:MAG: hypothetical protein M1833_004137 [Piccolia ochrophora]
MEQSPLTQQTRPDSFQPKVVELYQTLFKEDEEEEEKLEGFWLEFFLLRPDKPKLQSLLADLSPEDLLHLHPQTRSLFLRAVSHVKRAQAPSDDIALDTLTAFLGGVLTKKYNNPSSDVINVLVGLDEVDAVFSDFVGALDVTIRNGREFSIRKKAIEVALSLTAGAYQTGLLSYLTHRDLFPSLMKYVQDSTDPAEAFEPFALLGLLANYNKFESQNPYRLRLDDFVNEGAIQRIVRAVGVTCGRARDRYVEIQDDVPEGWTLNSTLSYLGLGALTQTTKAAPAAPSPEEAKTLFAALPPSESAILLATYEFANANKLFCFNLVSLPPDSKHDALAFSEYLSFTSYLLNHAFRSQRTSHYAYLNLLVLRILVEDQVLCKRICGDETKITVRLCRQRQPYLPVVRGERIGATVILDLMVESINKNLRRRLDVDLYLLTIAILHRLISILSRSRTRLAYHWSELWRALLSLVRFLATYASDHSSHPTIHTLLDDLVNLIALALSAGDAFLPGPAEYDDLFYKLIESSDVLIKFKDAYSLDTRPRNSISTLIAVNTHYQDLLASQPSTKVKNLSPRQVSRVIKSGYETLSITAREGLDSWERYREIGEKAFLKKVARVAVGDVKEMVGSR